MTTLTAFQKDCESSLQHELHKRGISHVDRQTAGEHETYVGLEVAEKNLKLWIYENEAMFIINGKSYAYEAPDYPREGALLDAFVTAVTDCVDGKPPRDPGSTRITLVTGRTL